jgi:predicted anti-sigma-YlaC factor YlaD
MGCETYQQQMSLWIDNQLTQGEIRHLEAHTATCPACRAAHDQLQRVDLLLSSVPMISPAPGFRTRFDSRLAAHRGRRRTWAGLAILTLATLALLVGAMILLGISGVALWRSISASGLLTQGIGLLLDLGKAMGASLRLAWLVMSAFAQGLRHPAFIAYAIATATLVVAWTQIVARRILSHRPVTINSHG